MPFYYIDCVGGIYSVLKGTDATPDEFQKFAKPIYVEVHLDALAARLRRKRK